MTAHIPLLLLCLCCAASAVAHPALERRIAALDTRLQLHPEDVEAWLARADAHRDHQDFATARKDLKQARRIAPGRSDVDLALGRLELEAGQARLAELHLTAFLAIEPGLPRAHVLRARARLELGRPLDAAADYGFVIDTQPKTGPDLFLRRAEALATAGPEHFQSALATLKDGLARRGPVPTLALAAVELELALSQVESALARLSEMASRASRPGPWLLRKGEVLENAGRPKDARACYLSIGEGLTATERSRKRNRAVLESASARLQALGPEATR